MAKNKTIATSQSVEQFISKVEDETKRDDSYELIKIFKSATGEEAKMWGPSIIGFGSYHYKYESGHEGDACLTGFSPRKSAIVLYIMNFEGKDELLTKLGKLKPSKGCIYIKKLEDINVTVLKNMIDGSVKYLKKKYGA